MRSHFAFNFVEYICWARRQRERARRQHDVCCFRHWYQRGRRMRCVILGFCFSSQLIFTESFSFVQDAVKNEPRRRPVFLGSVFRELSFLPAFHLFRTLTPCLLISSRPVTCTLSPAGRCRRFQNLRFTSRRIFNSSRENVGR